MYKFFNKLIVIFKGRFLRVVSDLVKNFLEHGVHFGHQTSKWNPKMERFIFGQKEGIYIIDLLKTEKLLVEALEYIRKIVSEGKKILFVGTKRQAQNIISEQCKRCSSMYYVNERWLGGTLTNFNTIRRSVDKFKDLKKMHEDGRFELLSKKEQSQLNKEMERLRKNLEGIENMNELPDALFIIDPDKELIAVKEAKKLSIPIIAVIDTNCDPELIDFPIPSNDDAIKSIKFIVSMVVDNILEAEKEYAKISADTKSEKEEKKTEKEKKSKSVKKKDINKKDASGKDEEKFEEIEEKHVKKISEEVQKAKRKKPGLSKEK